jgi:hypothetical protein
MAKKITPEQKSAIKEGLRVFVWAGLSAVLPILIGWMSQDPRWVVMIPVVNAVAYSLKIGVDNRKS